ncbi:MAG: putative manganese transporter [Calditrichaceae bacterium]
MEILKIIEHALMITSFVFIMMLLIEYINVQTRGNWQESLKKSRWGQYLLSAFLGSVPGCLGAFTVVSLYSHRVVSFGALVTAMIATSGDESFVMFSMFPRQALWLTVILFFAGIAAGYVTDMLYKKQDLLLDLENHNLPIHKPEVCHCFPSGEILRQLKNSTLPRALLIGIFGLFLFFMISGSIGPAAWNWKKITFTGGAVFGLFVVSTVPDHFLEQHLWQHVLKKHLPRIFIWTFAVLLILHYMENYIDVKPWIQENYFQVLIIAILVGIIPESGPHLVFVTLYAAGSLPFSILLASSIVQDGHGMLPMLAVSRKGFLLVKGINILVGLIIGLIFQTVFF